VTMMAEIRQINFWVYQLEETQPERRKKKNENLRKWTKNEVALNNHLVVSAYLLIFFMGRTSPNRKWIEGMKNRDFLPTSLLLF